MERDFYRDAAAATARAARVRVLCLDVDGTLTDGRLYMRGGVIERAFGVLDGLGVQLFVRAGGEAAIVTAAAEEEGGAGIRVRAAQMGVGRVFIGVTDKLAVVRGIAADAGVGMEEVAFAGDDLPDLAAMRAVGFAAAPRTAAAEVLAAAHYVAVAPAGGGAVREVCEFVLAARGEGGGGGGGGW